MEYALLGKTGRKVSRIGFGGATAGLKNYVHAFDPDKPEDREPILLAIRRAFELGINYFDTAAGYGEGRSERIFGDALQTIPPDDLFLATKVWPKKKGVVRPSLEQSLKNLRRDRVDLLQLHGTVWPTETVDAILEPGGILDEMEKARDEGLIRYVGFTYEACDANLYRLIHSGRFDVCQFAYNFLFQHPYDPSWKCGCFYELENRGIGIVAMRSTTSGLFQKWIRTVNPDNTFDYTPALIQFQLSNPLVDVALIGMRSVRRVEQNVAIVENLDGRLDLDELHKRYV
jgi:aryl-alcohol dehydrogenase-like predicted oxidoreductase